jgi:hypothetical protein
MVGTGKAKNLSPSEEDCFCYEWAIELVLAYFNIEIKKLSPFDLAFFSYEISSKKEVVPERKGKVDSN